MTAMHFGFTLTRSGFQAAGSNVIEHRVAVTLPTNYVVSEGDPDTVIAELEAFIQQAQDMVAELKEQ